MVLGVFQQQPLVNNCHNSEFYQLKVSLFLDNYNFHQLLLFYDVYYAVMNANEKSKDE